MVGVMRAMVRMMLVIAVMPVFIAPLIGIVAMIVAMPVTVQHMAGGF